MIIQKWEKPLRREMAGVQCDRVACGAVLPVKPSAWSEQVRSESQAAGWAVAVQNPESKRRARTLDFCPECAADRAKRAWLCQVCPGGGLHEVMGHDKLGHRVARALHELGLVTVPEVARLSPADLLDVRGLGDSAIERVRETVWRPGAESAAGPAGIPSGPATSVSP